MRKNQPKISKLLKRRRYSSKISAFEQAAERHKKNDDRNFIKNLEPIKWSGGAAS